MNMPIKCANPHSLVKSVTRASGHLNTENGTIGYRKGLCKCDITISLYDLWHWKEDFNIQKGISNTQNGCINMN